MNPSVEVLISIVLSLAVGIKMKWYKIMGLDWTACQIWCFWARQQTLLSVVLT